jgi:hypothetical protein
LASQNAYPYDYWEYFYNRVKANFTVTAGIVVPS